MCELIALGRKLWKYWTVNACTTLKRLLTRHWHEVQRKIRQHTLYMWNGIRYYTIQIRGWSECLRRAERNTRQRDKSITHLPTQQTSKQKCRSMNAPLRRQIAWDEEHEHFLSQCNNSSLGFSLLLVPCCNHILSRLDFVSEWMSSKTEWTSRRATEQKHSCQSFSFVFVSIKFDIIFFCLFVCVSLAFGS